MSGLQNVNKVIFIFSECNVKIIYTLRAYPIRAILLAILGPGQCSKSSRTTCTLRFLRAVRVQTGCANNA
ncbi:hypothetical protein D5G71_23450, partial [Salmonella enterica subsp. enterica serovar Mbandaka]